MALVRATDMEPVGVKVPVDRVVEVSGSRAPAGDQDVAVGEEGRRLAAPGDRHRPGGRGPGIGRLHRLGARRN